MSFRIVSFLSLLRLAYSLIRDFSAFKAEALLSRLLTFGARCAFFFSTPIEERYFGKGVRHLYEEEREFEHLPFYPSYTGLLAKGISTGLWRPAKTSFIYRHISLFIWPKTWLHFRFGATVTLTR